MGINALVAALDPMEIASGLVLAVKYLVSNPEQQPQGHEHVPLRRGGPPAYMSQATNRGRYGYGDGGAHRPNAVEYGRVDRCTPLPR